VLLALSCLFASGCKVTQADIDTWTGTQKGPGKIVAVLLADKYEDELRAYAGMALVRMEPRAASTGQEAVDGVSELQAAVRQLPEDTRTRLVDRMTPGLVGMMRGEGTTSEQGLSRPQIRAKDAAFLLLPYASAERQRELSEAVVDWFVVDFNARAVEGNYTAEQVVRQLGAPAASRLIAALDARVPQPALVKLAEIIAAVGDAATKTRAAARLVEIEREMESPEFLTYLQGRLRDQLQGQMDRGERPRGPIDDARVAQAAALNRDQFINIGALPAMKHLNSQRPVQDRLFEIAVSNTADEERRTRALQALEGGVRPDQVDGLLTLALEPSTPIRVRDYAFDRVADARQTSVLARLWPVFEQRPHPDWRLRWRVGALILSIGGNDVVQEFFNRLGDQPYAREELHNYGEKISQMRPAPNELMDGQLRSPIWYVRAIALYFWEKRATAEDLPRITALEADAAATQGENWRDQTNLGLVAQAVARVVRERLAQAERNRANAGGAGGGGGQAAQGQPGGGESGGGSGAGSQ
jgi:hypothetical protein